MEYLSSSSSSIFGPLYSQNDEIFQSPAACTCPTTQLQAPGDQIIPTQPQQDGHDADFDVDVDADQLLFQLQQDHDHHNNNDPLVGANHSQGRKTSLGLLFDTCDHHHDENPCDKKKRQKIIHREIERQRRLEMSLLHGSLRSLLPIDYVKGKRSMSDHLNETVRYIKHLQQRIQVLNGQRDALKLKVSNSKTPDVRVNHCNGGGVEIIVCTHDPTLNQGLPLSTLLQCLLTEGLDVISCISNKLDNNKLVHTIQAQVGDGRNIAIDAVELQQKLTDIY